jgi:hypothetical protein
MPLRSDPEPVRSTDYAALSAGWGALLGAAPAPQPRGAPGRAALHPSGWRMTGRLAAAASSRRRTGVV